MMISEGVTKGHARSSEASHSFPLLNKNTLNDAASASKSRHQDFKPLFDADHLGDPVSPRSGLGVPQPDVVRESSERISQKGYRRGFDAGNQDACSMVREEMEPQLKSVADAFNQWNAAMLRLEVNSDRQILQVAVSVAEKILEGPPECDSGRLDSLRGALRDHMRKAYRLVFKLNPEDMDVLSALMDCEHSQWGQWDYISVEGDIEVQRGSLRVQPGTKSILTADGIIRALEVLLSKASTK
jgi:Flagellar assembly protein FliH